MDIAGLWQTGLVRRELDSLRGLDKLLEGLQLVANSLEHGSKWPRIHGGWDVKII